MPSIYDLKPKFQALLRPITQRMARMGITPNQVTVSALLFSMATGVVIATQRLHHWPLLLLPAVLLIRMALNAIDGMLAREYGMKSHLGAILNEISDVISDAALYLPLALVSGFAAPLVIAFVVLSIIGEMTGVIGIQVCGKRQYAGPMGKSDRAFVIGVLGLLIGFGVSPGRWLNAVLGFMVALSVLTIPNRARIALREAK